MIMFFGAPWCVSCKGQYPIWQMFAEKYGHEIEYIDIDQNPGIATEHSISGLPTVVFADGRRYPGAQNTTTINKACADVVV
jgi:thiol-disulfide isomerase/thioredoxin